MDVKTLMDLWDKIYRAPQDYTNLIAIVKKWTLEQIKYIETQDKTARKIAELAGLDIENASKLEISVHSNNQSSIINKM